MYACFFVWTEINKLYSMQIPITFSFLFFLLFSASPPVEGSPLHTHSRWIVNEEGQRVKLACVNWVSHMEALLAEGLSKQPLDRISKRIKSLGFNCVRLTWPLFLLTNTTMANSTVVENFQNLGLGESIGGMEANNPTLLHLPAIKAYQEVVWNLGRNNIMVILDNHISKPGWCCSITDGSGFFGDRYFDPETWINGLTKMATMFNNNTNVIGMSLRNELRGPKQNTDDWFRYMRRGAEAVHAANPNVLVILSGLNFDTDLRFLRGKEVNLTFGKKLVFEFHWYSFSNGREWLDGNPNQVCGRIVESVMERCGFLLDRGFPLFLSEFGMDQRGTNVADNRYMSCALGLIAELDLDWAVWTLDGSYYLREGVFGFDEVYGVLGWDWCGTRNTTLMARISSIQPPFRGPGPGLSRVPAYKILFHPTTGLCVLRNLHGSSMLGQCGKSEKWNYTSRKRIELEDLSLCLVAVGEGKPVVVGCNCDGSGSKWDVISDSKMHLSSTLIPDGGSKVCLDVDQKGTIVTNPCRCLSENKNCEAGSQWFKMVTTTRSTVHAEQ